MQIKVEETAAGWTVHDGATLGPFSRQRAMDLAEGMLVALREHTTEPVELIVVHRAAPKPVAQD